MLLVSLPAVRGRAEQYDTEISSDPNDQQIMDLARGKTTAAEPPV